MERGWQNGQGLREDVQLSPALSLAVTAEKAHSSM